MKLDYRVHSSDIKNYPTNLTLEDGSTVLAIVPVLIVELVPVGQHGEAGTIKLAIRNANAETINMFTMGSVISNTFTSGE